MHIDEKTWQDLKAEAGAGIERLNAMATERGAKDVFSFNCEERDGSAVLICTRTETSMRESRRLARDAGTGELLFSEIAFSSGEGWLARFAARLPIPSEWDWLADEPAREIVKKLRLLHFFGGASTELGA